MRKLTYVTANSSAARSETPFLRLFLIKCIILPRRARDKHKENSKKWRFPHDQGVSASSKAAAAARTGSGSSSPPLTWSSATKVRKTVLFAPFLNKMIILPRKARGKHRKTSTKYRFSYRTPRRARRRCSGALR